jgi:RsiW-degrading membrane proteinase PrsW (M82 family)
MNKIALLFLFLILFSGNAFCQLALNESELRSLLEQKDSIDISVLERCVYNYYAGEKKCEPYSKQLQPLTLSESTQKVSFSLELFNRSSAEMKFYGLINKGKWENNSMLSTLLPFETKQADFAVDLNFSAKRIETIELAVIGLSSEKKIKKTILLELDWGGLTAKEEFTHAMVSPAIAIGLFVFALTIFIAIAVIFRSKRERKKYGKQHIIARIFLHPAFWAFEILIAVLDVWQLFTLNYSPTAVAYYIDSFIIAGVFALVFPAVFLIVIWLADVYEREPLRFVFSMLLWGLVASAIALVVNTSIFTPIRQAGGLAFIFLAIVIAPVVEELSKGLGIFAISKHSEMNGALDGIVYGFSIGLGFALTENWLYFSNYSPASLGIELSGWVFLLFYRSIFSCLGHGWITATTGAVMGFFKERSGKSSIVFFLPAVAAAIILHGIANSSALPDAIASAAAGSEVMFFSPLADISLTVIFGAIIFAYSREARKKAQLEGKKPSQPSI